MVILFESMLDKQDVCFYFLIRYLCILFFFFFSFPICLLFHFDDICSLLWRSLVIHKYLDNGDGFDRSCRGITSIHQIACGSNHCIILASVGPSQKNTEKFVAYSWGAGTYGRLGLGNEVGQSTPCAIEFFDDKDVRISLVAFFRGRDWKICSEILSLQNLLINVHISVARLYRFLESLQVVRSLLQSLNTNGFLIKIEILACLVAQNSHFSLVV